VRRDGVSSGNVSDPARELAGLDRLIHEPGRLALFAILYTVKKADFLYLQRQTGFTGGNLSSHLSKLEGAGYVGVEKRFNGKMPQTIYELTKTGRVAFERYRATLLGSLAKLPD
jgi:DNA-binding MarR family transcriptional regulator